MLGINVEEMNQSNKAPKAMLFFYYLYPFNKNHLFNCLKWINISLESMKIT